MKKILLILLLIPNFLLAKEQCENMQQPPQEFMGMELITFKKYDDPKMGVGVTYWIKSKVFTFNAMASMLLKYFL